MNKFSIIHSQIILFISDKPEFPTVSSPVEVIEGEPFEIVV